MSVLARKKSERYSFTRADSENRQRSAFDFSKPKGMDPKKPKQGNATKFLVGIKEK